jgi:hypothetical protein
LTLQPQSQFLDNEIENRFDFILSHFEGYLTFPRRIVATELMMDQKKYQHFKIVLSREQALDHFKKYNYVDCRMNAFPYLKENILWKPYLLFIDLDLPDFKSRKSLDLALSKTLKNIKEILNGYPTVLWSGNGYHVIQPVDCPIELEDIKEFEKYKNIVPLLSQEFLRFAKDFLSNGKADKNNHPSFNSCLLRIPSSINSKCLDNREKRLSGIKVKVLQKWNRDRVMISREFIEEFRTYLEQKLADQEQQQINNNSHKKYSSFNINNNQIDWIEKLLQTPIQEYRKRAVELIFVPYFILVKKLSNEETISKITEWLQKCDLESGRRLNFNIRSKINAAIKYTLQKQIPPMKKSTLKTNYKDLFLLFE